MAETGLEVTKRSKAMHLRNVHIAGLFQKELRRAAQCYRGSVLVEDSTGGPSSVPVMRTLV